MNTAFVNIIQRIVHQQGEAILDDPARLKQFVHKEAQAVPAELRLACGRCIEQGYYRLLKRAGTAAERSRIKPRIARQMHNISKSGAGGTLGEALCAEAVDVLEAVLYGPQYTKTAQQTVRRGQFPFRLPRSLKGAKKAIIALSAAALAVVVIVITALNWGVAAFEPIVEFNGEAYPSKIIATAAVSSMLGGGPRMIETDDYIGDALGDFGVKFRSALPAALPGGVVRVEIEGDYFITKSTLEAHIQTKKSIEIFPRINYNYAELEKLREPHTENVTFRLYVNDKLKKQKTLAVPFHRVEDEPVWDASRNGNKTLNNYHFVVVIRQAERIERELERIQREAEAEAARQREAMKRETEAEAARRREAERRAAEAERRAAEAARARPSPAPLRDPYNDKRIWNTIAKVHDNLYDVNGDGQTTCVDYSNLFYYYSPFKYNDVVVNYNKNTGFNHQFNAVTIDGQIVYVEPQAKTPRSYDLRKFWGSKYNPNYNQMGNTSWLFLPRGESGTEE
jgi:hypothetical protein